MKRLKLILTGLCLLWVQSALGQSVYQCLPWQSPMSPAMTFTPSAYIQNCFDFTGSTYLYQQGDIHLEAVNYFLMDPGFQAGQMEPGGSMLMQMAQQPAGFDIFLMSGQSVTGLPRFKKIEFGVQLESALHDRIESFVHPDPGNTATPLNPYLEEKLDVQMIFTHESGFQRKVDAFYYQDFYRDENANDWVEVATEYPMRIRFAPNLNGKWGVRTSVTVEGVHVADLLPFSFEVVESGHPGYVTVHPNGRNFQRNNRIIFPVGHNFPSPVSGVDIYAPDPNATNKAAKVDDWKEYHTRVEDFAMKGGKFFRTLQAPWSSLIEFEHLGNYTNRLHYAWEQDRLLETCDQYDLLMQFNLMQQEPIMKFANFGMSVWDFGHWNQDGSVNYADPYPAYCYYTPGKEPKEMFLDPTDIHFHRQRTRYYVSRYGYSPQIYAFELLNEPFHLGELSGNGGSTSSDVVLEPSDFFAIGSFHTAMAHYIKDSLGHTNQLIGVGQAKHFLTYPDGSDLNSLGWWDSLFDILDLSAQNSRVDYVFISEYADSPDKLLISKSGDKRLKVYDGENSHYARNSWMSYLYFDKPVMYSECGHTHNQLCSDYVGHYKDVMTFGFTGVAGFNMWSGYTGSYGGEEDMTHLQTSTIRAANHMNSTDVLFTLMSDGNNSGQWQQGREFEKQGSKEKMKEHQYYVSSDKLKAVGYIYNRTFNAYTNYAPANCGINNAILPNNNSDWNSFETITWDNNKMKIAGLHGDELYKIDFYSYKEGNFVSSVIANASFGKLTLHHPDMDPTENPILWYVVHRANAGRSMAEGAEELNSEVPSGLSLSIYPNPSSGHVNLKIDAPEGRMVSLQIFDLVGQQVYGQEGISVRELSLDTGLPQGVYLIKITDGENAQTKKFIVQ